MEGGRPTLNPRQHAFFDWPPLHALSSSERCSLSVPTLHLTFNLQALIPSSPNEESIFRSIVSPVSTPSNPPESNQAPEVTPQFYGCVTTLNHLLPNRITISQPSINFRHEGWQTSRRCEYIVRIRSLNTGRNLQRKQPTNGTTPINAHPFQLTPALPGHVARLPSPPSSTHEEQGVVSEDKVGPNNLRHQW